MALDNDYLEYPWRNYGNDHDRFEWTMIHDRSKIEWPDKKPLALWVNTSVQFFPLNQRGKPFKVPHGMTMPYPDLRHFSLRDYGNRVGIFRFFELFNQYDIPVTYAVSAQLAEDAPYLLKRLGEQNGEIICHGWNMDHLHYGGLSIDDERVTIQKAVNTLREASGQSVRGWLSPARNQSENTPDLIAEAGIDFCCDWVNDDLPYDFKTTSGNITMLPLQTEIEDAFVIGSNLHSEDSWVAQVIDAVDYLIEDAKANNSGRMLGLSLHPWMTGQPHRIGALETVLKYISEHNDIWLATASDIVDHSKAARG